MKIGSGFCRSGTCNGQTGDGDYSHPAQDLEFAQVQERRHAWRNSLRPSACLRPSAWHEPSSVDGNWTQEYDAKITRSLLRGIVNATVKGISNA